jgi:molybdopterin converting factor small subunit
MAETATTEPNLTLERATKARCPHCQHEKVFTGSVIDSLACPKCETQMTIVAATGPTVDEALKAFETAAAALPAEKVERGPRQQTIPGLKPKFDWESAMRSILDARYEVRVSAARVEQKAGEKKLAEKVHAEKTAALHQLEDDYAQRVKELEEEAERQAAQAEVDRFADEGNPHDPDATPAVDAATAATEERETAEATPLGTDAAPASEESASASAFDEALEDDYAQRAKLQALMTEAGAVVPLGKIAAWTQEERVLAAVWATEQLAANIRAGDNQIISVQWPDHVSRDRVQNELEPKRKKPKRAAVVSGGQRGGKTRKAGQKK